MRSAAGDRTAKAVIRDEALRLFAAAGPDAVTIRQIAAAAGVSPGLVVHHFGSKEGLRMAVDEKVAGIFDVLFEQAGGDAAALRSGSAASLAELMVRELPPDSAVPAYLRRLLLSGDEAGRALVRRWYDSSRTMIEQLGAAGVIRAGDDPAALAAFLMVNDLAMILLRDQVRDVLGTDPLAAAGMGRWFATALAVYRDGLFQAPDDLAPDDLAPDDLAPDDLAPDDLAPGDQASGGGQ